MKIIPLHSSALLHKSMALYMYLPGMELASEVHKIAQAHPILELTLTQCHQIPRDECAGIVTKLPTLS